MKSKHHIDLVEEFVQRFGEDELESLLNARLSPDAEILTIIGNEGIHSFPSQYLHGDVYVASTGNLNLETEESIRNEYGKILSNLSAKLNEKSWQKIYFIPTGHTTLALQIKQLVYHVLRISTVDLFYLKGKYFELDLDYREVLLDQAHNE